MTPISPNSLVTTTIAYMGENLVISSLLISQVRSRPYLPSFTVTLIQYLHSSLPSPFQDEAMHPTD